MQDSNHRTTIGFRAWLFFLAVFSVLPMIVFSLVSIHQLAVSQRDVESLELSRRAGMTAAVLDRHLTAWVAMLDALVQSQSARDNDLHGLYSHAARLVPITPSLAAVALVDADGNIVFNTLHPFGTHLPRTTEPELARRVIQTGRPLVSGATYGAISNKPVLVLGVPVWVQNEVRYCLRAVMPVKELGTLLNSDAWPEGWRVAVRDADGHILARGGQAAASELDPLAAEVAEVPKEPEITSSARVASWGWRVDVTVSQRVLAAPLRALLRQNAIGGLLCLVVGFAAAYLLSRKLAGDMDKISTTSAAMLAGDRPVVSPRPMIRELGEVQACLWEARDREELAKTDPVTQLPGRARFWELASELERRCRENDDLGLAVLFIDLDGFKQINDRFGHERGDWALYQAAEAVRRTMRDGDVIGRMGGDEFAVCLATGRNLVFEAAGSIAGRIVAQVAKIGYGLGCSVGVSVCSLCRPDLERALNLADAAMYEAKRLGKNRYILHEDVTRG